MTAKERLKSGWGIAFLLLAAVDVVVLWQFEQGRAEAQLPPPVTYTAIICEEVGVEITYEAARYDVPGEWSSRTGRSGGRSANAWRIDLGNGEEVVTTAPCRLTRPPR